MHLENLASKEESVREHKNDTDKLCIASHFSQLSSVIMVVAVEEKAFAELQVN